MRVLAEKRDGKERGMRWIERQKDGIGGGVLGERRVGNGGGCVQIEWEICLKSFLSLSLSLCLAVVS